MEAKSKNTIHCGKCQVRAQSPGQTLRLVGKVTAINARYAVKGLIEGIHTKTDRPWKCVMQDQKLRNLPTCDMSPRNLEIGLHCTAGAEDGHPLCDIHVPTDLLAAGEQEMVFEVEHSGGGVRAFDIFTSLDELPPLAVRHGRIRDPLKRMEIINEQTEKADGTFAKCGARGRALEIEVEAVDLLPHLAGYLLANGARIFSSQRHGRQNRTRVGFLESHEIHNGFAGDFAVDLAEKFPLFGCRKDGHPLLAHFFIVVLLKIESDLDIHIEDAGIRLSALEIATEPEARIGYAA